MPLDLSHLEISLSSWGCFPDIGPERVLWIGVDVNSTAWRSLLSSIANYLAFFDIQVDTGNSIPHITVGRVRRPNQVRGLREQIGQLKVASESCSIETLELVESMQSKDGSIYRVRASKRIEGRVG
jgi:2'-5' RNA ligase